MKLGSGKAKVKELDDAVAEGRQYVTLSSTNIRAAHMDAVLNDAWARGYRLVGVAGQQSATLFVLERRDPPLAMGPS